MSIGKTDSRTDGPSSGIFGTALGLFAPETHNKFEIDGSFAMVDAHFAQGDTNTFSSGRWSTYRQLAGKHGFSIGCIHEACGYIYKVSDF